MEKINEDIVNSAIAFGNWLNSQAFTYASNEIHNISNFKEDKKKKKEYIKVSPVTVFCCALYWSQFVG